jgi:hypothetical protein
MRDKTTKESKQHESDKINRKETKKNGERYIEGI